jgi:hypothetical protein
MILTGRDLAQIGTLIYGPRGWRTRLAERLGKSERAIYAHEHEGVPLKRKDRRVLADLVKAQIDALARYDAELSGETSGRPEVNQQKGQISALTQNRK